MREIDELRQLTAGRLLTIWRECGQAAEDPLERSLLSNAQVLAESCRCQGEPVFPDSGAVLAELTAREMELLLERLMAGRQLERVNPGFDQARFEALREG
jgi:hypothetical protein